MMNNREEQSTQRHQLSKRMAREMRYQIHGLSGTDVGAYSYEEKKSNFKDAKADLSIYNTDGKLVLLGRDFGDRTFYWSAEAKDVRLTT
jgi:predicted ribosome-associated RNA-binding protein Tma20